MRKHDGNPPDTPQERETPAQARFAPGDDTYAPDTMPDPDGLPIPDTLTTEGNTMFLLVFEFLTFDGWTIAQAVETGMTLDACTMLMSDLQDTLGRKGALICEPDTAPQWSNE